MTSSGAALQAAWVVSGERLEELVQRFVALEGETIEPGAERVALYRELQQRFRGAVERGYS